MSPDRSRDLLGRHLILVIALALFFLGSAGFRASTAPAAGLKDAAAPMPRHWHAPATWLGHPATSASPATGAWCIHEHEGAWNAIGYVNGIATYGGGMQFMLGTWHRAGGAANSLWDIARASPREQLYRAWLIWNQDGRRWSAEWGTAGVCGLR